MTYTGNVAPGGPADVRQLAGLSITKVSVGRASNNAYFLRCTATGQVLLVDAAAEPERLLAELAALDGPLVRIVTTHQHDDHWAALGAVVEATGAVVAAHPLDAPGIGAPVDELVSDGAAIVVGELTLTAIHLAGHTPGGLALRYDDPHRPAEPHLFSGDSLFPGGVGNTWGNAEHFATLLEDVERKVFDPLPDGTGVYPGHGGDTTLGAERPHLAEWRERGW